MIQRSPFDFNVKFVSGIGCYSNPANENPTLTATTYTNLSQITWKSFTGNLFDNSNNYLDIAQGELGDCYLMAALAEISQHSPNLIGDGMNGMITPTPNTANTYTGELTRLSIKD